MFCLVAAIFSAFDPVPLNFYIGVLSTAFFVAVGAIPSTRGVQLVYLALFVIWWGAIVWWLGIRNAV